MGLQAREIRKNQIRKRFGTAFRSLMQMPPPASPFQPPERNSFRDYAYSIQHNESPDFVDRMLDEPAGLAGRYGGYYELSSGPIVANDLARREDRTLEGCGNGTTDQNEQPAFVNNLYVADDVVVRRRLRAGESQTATPPVSTPSERGSPRQRGETVVEGGHAEDCEQEQAEEAAKVQGEADPRDEDGPADGRPRYDSGDYGANGKLNAKEDGDEMDVEGGDQASSLVASAAEEEKDVEGGDEENPHAVSDADDEDSDLSDYETADEEHDDCMIVGALGAGKQSRAIEISDDEDSDSDLSDEDPDDAEDNITVARPPSATQASPAQTIFADPRAAGAITLPDSDVESTMETDAESTMETDTESRIDTDTEDIMSNTVEHARSSYATEIVPRMLERIRHSGERGRWRDMPRTYHPSRAGDERSRRNRVADAIPERGERLRRYALALGGSGLVEPEGKHEYKAYGVRPKARAPMRASQRGRMGATGSVGRRGRGS